MFLAQLAFVFVGIAGNHPDKVAKQFAPVLAKAHIKKAALPADTIRTLVHHGEGSAAIVKRLHADGVIGAELVDSDDGKHAFRVVYYRGDGGLESLGETPLVGRTLSRDDLQTFSANLTDELGSMPVHPAEPDPEPEPTPPTPTPALVPVAVAAAASPPMTTGEIEMDDRDSPLGNTPPPAKRVKPAKVATVEKATPIETAKADPAPKAAKPVETADAVSLDDIDAMTGGGGGSQNAADAVAANTDVAPSSRLAELHLHAGVGIGLASRSFNAGPTSIPNFTGTPVGAVHFEANACPTEHVALALAADRTLSMATPEADGMSDTTMSHWEVTAGYMIGGGSAFQLAPIVGLGTRAFSIDSSAVARTPDVSYRYVTLGAEAKASLGSHVALRGNAALQPVFGGTEPTEMAFGDATRWGVDVGASLEVKPVEHVFARLAVDYQRFSWSWDVGARGAGGAVDSYPSGMLSVGGDY